MKLSRYVRLATVLFALWSPARANACTASGEPGIIRRDAYGVPHILAATEQAAACAHGYATAEDHLPMLARLILRARGEQAAVFGEAYLREDLLIRALGIWEVAREKFGDLPPYMQALLNGYAEGYNTYLNEHQGEAPLWATPITGVDVLAHCRAVLLLNFTLDLRPWREASIQPEGLGSNMWAIGRGRSASGRGLLLANPHVDWGGPYVFHEVHITVPGKINVEGATLVGFPVITMGFNDYLGWSHTVNGVRAEEQVELTMDPSTPGIYQYDGLKLPIRTQSVSVRVKTANGEETRRFLLRYTHLGPVIRIANGKAYVYRSMNLDLVNFLTEYNLMAKARTLNDFRAVLNMQQLPTFNIGYTDRAGNTFYIYNGRIPLRAKASAEVQGDSNPAAWQIVYPVAELPQLINPPEGYIQNANNAPWYTTVRQSVDRARFAGYISGDGLSLRAQISLRMLESQPRLTLDRVMSLKGNETFGPADRLKSGLVQLARGAGGRQADLGEGVKLLEKWDNHTSIESHGSVLFERWFEEYLTRAAPAYKQSWAPARPTTTPSGIGDPRAAVAALKRAITDVKQQYGSLDVRWGDVHRLKRGNIELPIGGSDETFRTIWYQRAGNKRFATGGDSYVLAVEFTDSPTAYSVLAYSESSRTESPHFNDQLKLFAEKQYKRLWFSEEDIQRNLKQSYPPGRVLETTRQPDLHGHDN